MPGVVGLFSRELPRKSARTPASIPTLVYAALIRLLGQERAEILDFFIDTRLAALEPDRYERAVLNLLGEEGGRLVITALSSELARSTTVAHSRTESLLTEIRMVEQTFGTPPKTCSDA
jgi:hypothetical protein